MLNPPTTAADSAADSSVSSDWAKTKRAPTRQPCGAYVQKQDPRKKKAWSSRSESQSALCKNRSNRFADLLVSPFWLQPSLPGTTPVIFLKLIFSQFQNPAQEPPHFTGDQAHLGGVCTPGAFNTFLLCATTEPNALARPGGSLIALRRLQQSQELNRVLGQSKRCHIV